MQLAFLFTDELFELFARFKAGDRAFRDFVGFAGFWVAAGFGFTRLNLKRTKAYDFDFFAFGYGFLNHFQGSVDHCLNLRL